ncbi:uncharacterized protein MAM_02057 [Metarhizium album ARSEF 1941]|uniref:Uncharacterized protein n=1 Tax=Metarhizium album (strain ARSEF 1941) TaxID=1081103 RepID=A0A0B2X1C5_METAS|nr:uncharacterized protein MAM_02057 [Metarhizium album ARSEF 1941]KHO00134.1 hypothetical protein MAM_02057 [Metarhizium album ARSEF 1941]
MSSTQVAYEPHEPPPAYDPGRTRRMSVGRDAEGGRQRDGQTRALNGQKAVIEQRTEQLRMQETLPPGPLAQRH